MSDIRWKERYYDTDGVELTEASLTFYSLLGSSNGTGVRSNPFMSNYNKLQSATRGNTVLSAGYHKLRWTVAASTISGQGMLNTSLDVTVGNLLGTGIIHMKDLTLVNYTSSRYWQSDYVYYKNCRLIGDVMVGGYSHRFVNCIFDYANSNIASRIGTMSRCSVVNTNKTDGGESKFLVTGNLLDNCNVTITATILTSSNSRYIAFNNCAFKIGEEAAYTSLVGATEAELRQSFANRCAAQGLVVPVGSEYGDDNISMYRWIFDNNGAVYGQVVTNSIIDNFQQRRFVRLGYSDDTVANVPISKTATTPQSLSSDNLDSKLILDDGLLYVNPLVSSAQKNAMFVTSKILWLNGMRKVNSVGVINNLLASYGVMPNSTVPLSENPIGNNEVRPNVNYIVRSSDSNVAGVTYNGTRYTSSLGDRNHIFRGVVGATSFATDSNAQVYEVLDLAVLPTIQMRIVEDLPQKGIKSGSLDAGYWYFIAPDNLSNTNGYITYNGKQYPCYSSFIANAGLTFSINGNLNLCRCWRDNFDVNNEVKDAAYWAGKQKPLWFDVAPEDLRCLKNNDSEYSLGMKQDAEGKYIASGHPDFYASVLGDSGVLVPSFPIQGVFMQLRLVVSTLNPM